MSVDIEKLNTKLSGSSPEKVIEYFLSEYKDKIAFSTSLGAEDQVLMDMIANTGKSLKVFTLDTGRLFYETYDILDRTSNKYNVNIEAYFPDYKQIEKITRESGVNLFYDSIENRKLCCNTRKIEPWKRAMEGMEAWITGIRKDQSVTRKDNKVVEFDKEYNLIKISPLLNWTEKEVWNYIHSNNVPYNILHDKGYPSIGCAPCTRAVEKGENPRNGRWWWENPETRECGLHLHVKTN